jgi:hypothetical protein
MSFEKTLKRGSVVAVVSAALFAVFACSTPGPGSGAGDACGAYYDAYAKILTTCATDITASELLGSRAAFVRYCGIALSAPGTGTSAAYLNTCAGALNNTTGCDLKLNEIAGCEPQNGSLATGTACLGSDQCAGGACSITTTTNPDAGTSTTTGLNCGKCAPALAEGEACGNSSVNCARRLSCINQKCAQPPTSGSGVAEGGVCYTQDAMGMVTQSGCGSGLSCDIKFDTATNRSAGTCKRQPAKGEACTTRCASPLVCANKVCVDASTEGGPCPTGAECKGSLVCDQMTKTCKGPTIVEAGGECGKANVKCASGLNCISAGAGVSKCQTPIAENGACNANDQASRCDRYLKCIDGKCIFPDANLCK